VRKPATGFDENRSSYTQKDKIIFCVFLYSGSEGRSGGQAASKKFQNSFSLHVLFLFFYRYKDIKNLRQPGHRISGENNLCVPSLNNNSGLEPTYFDQRWLHPPNTSTEGRKESPMSRFCSFCGTTQHATRNKQPLPSHCSISNITMASRLQGLVSFFEYTHLETME
jgi:hypothetical protein